MAKAKARKKTEAAPPDDLGLRVGEAILDIIGNVPKSGLSAADDPELRAKRSISSRFLPYTLMPMGVRMPVESMSMRALIGMVHEFATPGNCSARSISAISLSVSMPGRHSSCGLRLMTVSNISSGAGSVAVCARPALPYTDATSGKLLMILFCVCSNSAALVTDMPGSDAGM